MTTITVRPRSAGWSFWLQWTLATAVGVSVLGTLAFGLSWGLAEWARRWAGDLAGIALGWSVGGALFGASFGLGPAIVLSGRIARPWRWGLASAIGGAVSLGSLFPILFRLFPDGGPSGGPLVQILFGAGLASGLGLAIGAGQWLVLRSQTRQAGWWVLASWAGITAGLAAGLPLGGEGREFLALGVTGVVTGMLTGWAMLRLLRKDQA